MACVYAVDELKASLKELQQTKLDNITEQFEAIASWSNAISSRSKALIDFYTSAGRVVNSTQAKAELGTQRYEASAMAARYKQEAQAYEAELRKAVNIFGLDSNEYREALATYEEIYQSLIEAQTEVKNLDKEIFELDLTKIERVIDRLTQFGEKLSKQVSLKEARGTIYGDADSPLRETDYSQQVALNNDVIKKYAEDREKRIEEINKFQWEIDSDNYKEAYDAIMKDDQAILDLLASNEQLKDSIRELRWKPFNDLQKCMEEAQEDIEHIRGLMKDTEWFDESTIRFSDKGYTTIALLGQEMQNSKKKISDYRVALDKVEKEYKNGNISLEEYNETSREYIKTVQGEVENLEGLKGKVLDMYKTQIQNENTLLQKNIQNRKEALAQKKAYVIMRILI